jgi:hypothetical protein
MRSAGILAIIAAFGSQTAFADVVRHSTIPESIRAMWAASAEDCDANKSVIVLSAKTYVNSEVNCTIGSGDEAPGQHGPMYSARMQAGPDVDHLMTYQRCPSNKK